MFFAPVHSPFECFLFVDGQSCFIASFKPPKIPLPAANMNRGHELDTIVNNGMQKSSYHSEIEPVTKEERDAQVLARLGKKSVLEV